MSVISEERTFVTLPRHAELMSITHQPVMPSSFIWIHWIYNTTFRDDLVTRTIVRIGAGAEIPDNYIWLGAVATMPIPAVPMAAPVPGAPLPVQQFHMGSVWHVFEEI